MKNIKMLYYDRLDVSEEIDVNKTSESRACDICHYWYFLNKGIKFQSNVCNWCHDLLTMSMNLNDIYILNIKNTDYFCIKYGWEQDKINEVMCLIGIPAGVSAAPPEVLKIIKCTCSSPKSCSTRRCSCVAGNVTCSLMCSCQCDRDTCCSESTKRIDGEQSDDDVLNELTNINGL